VRFRARKTVRFGPIRWHFTQSGYTGWAIKIWRYTWNARTRRSSFDTPGPGGVTWGGK